MSSREIAELTGKRHGDVIRDIRVMLDALPEDDAELRHVHEAQDARGYTAWFDLPKGLTITLVSGYSVQMRRRIVARWMELEAKQQPAAVPALNVRDPLQLAAVALQLVELNRDLQAERDRAVATKAEIGSRREATAMAKASAAVREANKLRDQLGAHVRHATVTAVERATGKEFAWLPLRAWCKAAGVDGEMVPDRRYGHVKAWPAAAWLEVYGIDLAALFELEAA